MTGSYLRQGLGLSIVFALIIAIATAAVVGAPAYQRHVFTEETAHTVGNMPALSRALQAEQNVTTNGISLPTVPLTEEFAALEDLDLPPVLAGVAGAAQVSAQTPEPGVFFTEAPMPGPLVGRALALIADSEALDAVAFLRGAPPEPNPVEIQAREAADSGEEFGPEEMRELLEEGLQVEIGLSAANAEILGLDVGDELFLPGLTPLTGLVVSGVFEPLDPQALAWQVHLRALDPFIDDDPNAGKTALGAALVNPDTPGWLTALQQGPTVKIRVPVNPEAADTQALANALLEFTSQRHNVAPSLEPVEFTSRLAQDLAEITEQRATSSAVLRAVMAGPLGATMAVAALMALVSRHRRRGEHELMSARGASGTQLRLLGGVQGGLIGLPSLAVGAALGSPLAGLAMGLVPAAALAASPLKPPRPTRARATLITAGALGVLGLTAAGIYSAAVSFEPDPLTTALPVLLAASIAILLLVLTPWIMRVLHRLAARASGLTAFLGSARAVRQSRAGWPILTLVVALGAAIFASTTLTTVTDSARTSAFEAVGADVRLSTGWLSPEDQAEIATLPGVEAATAVHRLDSTHVGGSHEYRRATLIVVDTEELLAAQAHLPSAMDLTDLTQGEDGVIPAITSPNLLDAHPEPAVHLGDWLPIEVQETLPDVPGLTEAGAWIIIDSGSLPEPAWEQFPQPRLMLLATDGTAETAQRVHDLAGGVVSTPLEALAEFNASPVVRGLGLLAWWALVISALLAGLAVVLFLPLTAPERRYVSAVVHTLGGRAGRSLSAWEALPVVLGGITGGLGAGLALPHLLNLDLSVFTGDSGGIRIVVDLWRTAGIGAVVVGVVALGIVGGSLVSTRRRQRALRIGE